MTITPPALAFMLLGMLLVGIILGAVGLWLVWYFVESLRGG